MAILSHLHVIRGLSDCIQRLKSQKTEQTPEK
jgi:hypothetical protein